MKEVTVMTREFMEKVKEHGIYDTRAYRYVYNSMTDRIQRIRIEYLDSVKALDPEYWEEVKA